MRLLLDTQAFLWFLTDDPRLSSTARTAIISPESERYLSAASVWEIAIKIGVKKLRLSKPIEQLLREDKASGLQPLPVAWQHAVAIQGLPQHHKDPFDRILAAQAMVEGMALVSSDKIFNAYGVNLIW